MVLTVLPQNQNTAISTQTVGVEGFDDFDPRQDLKVPVLKIVQGTSRMEGANRHGGDFYNTISQGFTETLKVVPLTCKHARQLFGDEGDKPECRSDDCVTGTTYGRCLGCDFNADIHPELWEKGNPTKRCDKGYRMLLIQPDEGSFVAFSAFKTNVNPIKVLNTLIATVGRKKTGIAALFTATFTFATELKEGDGKKWYQLLPKVDHWHSPEEIAEYRDYAASMRGTSVEIVEDVETDADPSLDDAPGPDAQVFSGPDFNGFGPELAKSRAAKPKDKFF